MTELIENIMPKENYYRTCALEQYIIECIEELLRMHPEISIMIKSTHPNMATKCCKINKDVDFELDFEK